MEFVHAEGRSPRKLYHFKGLKLFLSLLSVKTQYRENLMSIFRSVAELQRQFVGGIFSIFL